MSGVLPPATAQKEQRRLSKISELLRRKEMLAGPVHPTSRPPSGPSLPSPKRLPHPRRETTRMKALRSRGKEKRKRGPTWTSAGPLCDGDAARTPRGHPKVSNPTEKTRRRDIPRNQGRQTAAPMSQLGTSVGTADQSDTFPYPSVSFCGISCSSE
ncbi:unnamed protein product [Ixodes pacificus]